MSKSERVRVVFDLDETLINTNADRVVTLRPGTERLLAELKAADLDLILWTTARRQWVDEVFSQFPGLRTNFSKIITADEADRFLNPLRNEAVNLAKIDKNDPRVWCLKTLLG